MSGTTSGGTIIGSGSDSIVLQMSEDQSQGVDAQFTVNVDGEQIGGLQTVTASHSSGQDQTFTFLGNYAPGTHNVTVTFANNFQYPGSSGDRNLYVDGVTYDGQTISNSTTGIYTSPVFQPNLSQDYFGNAVYTVNDTTGVPNGSSSNPTTTPGAVSIGSGPDTLVLHMAEDYYQGDAQFTVAVDGQQIGGTQTTTAIVSEGQSQEFDVHGNFGGGTHRVTVTYTNDQVGGYYPANTPGVGDGGALDTADRNLYVISANLDGGPNASGTPWEQANTGSQDYYVTSGGNQNAGSASDNGNSASASTTGASSSAAGATSDTTTVTSDSLNAGSSGGSSSSGMSFVTASSGDGASSSDASTATASGGGSSDASTDTGAGAAIASTGGQGTQDFTAPVSTSAGTTDTTSSSSGSGTHWWHHDGGSWSGWQAAHQAA